MDKNRFAELLAKSLGKDLSAAEQAELEQFLAVEHYEEIYTIIKTKNLDSSVVKEEDSLLLLERLRTRMEEGSAVPSLVRRLTSSYFFRGAAILFCILMGALAYLYIYRADVSAEYVVQRVDKGTSKQSFVLPDGSTVVLNAGSELRYPVKFSGNLRELRLSGEAFFDVKKDPKHPFVIHTRDMDVKVLGTAFNVRAYANEAESQTALIRGKVEVQLNNATKEKVLLSPSHKLIVKQTVSKDTLTSGQLSNKPGKLIASVTDLQLLDDNIVETSWLRDKLVFKDTPFWRVCRDIERQYGVDINIKTPALENLRFSASFEKNSLKEIMSALSSAEDFQYTINKKTITIY